MKRIAEVGNIVAIKYGLNYEEAEVLELYNGGEFLKFRISDGTYKGIIIVLDKSRVVGHKTTKEEFLSETTKTVIETPSPIEVPPTPKKENFFKKWVSQWLN
jgi:hypothetical protein